MGGRLGLGRINVRQNSEMQHRPSLYVSGKDGCWGYGFLFLPLDVSQSGQKLTVKRDYRKISRRVRVLTYAWQLHR